MIESISRGGGGGREGGRETRGGKEKFLRYHEEPYQISREAEGERDSTPPPSLLESQLEAQSHPLLKHGYTSYLVFAATETYSNRYESLATIWNPWSVQVVVPPFPGDGQIVPRTEIECRTSF